jgi:hypothetical protein
MTHRKEKASVLTDSDLNVTERGFLDGLDRLFIFSLKIFDPGSCSAQDDFTSSAR